MSTKTTFKRIALATVAAMGFGLLSVVPGNAASSAAAKISSIALSADVSSVAISATSTISVTPTIAAAVAADADTLVIKGYVLSKPAGAVTVLTSTAGSAITAKTLTFATTGATANLASLIGAVTTAATTHTGAALFGTIGVTSTVAGSVVVRVWNDGGTSPNGVVDPEEAYQDITITVVSAVSGTPQLSDFANSASTTAGVNSSNVGLHVTTVGVTQTTASGRTGVAVGFAPNYTVKNYVGAGTSTNLNLQAANLDYAITNPAGTAVVAYTAIGGTTASAQQYVQGANTTLAHDVSQAAAANKGSVVYFNPATAGTYTITVYHDANRDDLVSVGEASATTTVVVAADALPSITFTNYGQATPENSVDGAIGALMKITMKNGTAAASLAENETLTITAPTNSVIDNKSVLTGTSFAMADAAATTSLALTRANFNGKGEAYINIGNTTAAGGTFAVSATISGGTAAGATGSTSFTVVDTATNAVNRSTADTAKAVTNPGNLLGVKGATAALIANGAGDQATTWYVKPGVATTVSAKMVVGAVVSDTFTATVTDTRGLLTGMANAAYKIAKSTGTTVTTTTSVTFSVAVPALTVLQTSALTLALDVADASGDTAVQQVITVSPEAVAATFSYTNPAQDANSHSIRAGVATSNKLTAKVIDQFGNALPNIAVTAAIAGRNSTTVIPAMLTNATGEVSYTLTDTSVSTLLLTDTVTFTPSAGATSSVTINYAAYLPAATITLTTPDSANATATGIKGSIKSDISSLDGAEAGVVDVKAVLKDANGATLPAGIPVTFSVAGTGVAILSTHVTLYTDALGAVTTKVYAWTNGDRVVTATAGAITASGTIYFRQGAAVDGVQAEARTISAKATGNVVTATVTDRFGNPISGISVVATRVGTGTFNGTSSITGVTAADGTVDFVLSNGTADVTVGFTSSTFGASAATKGYKDAGITALTAYTAGTAVLAEEGVGASFDAAGVNSVKVLAVTDTATLDQAQAATDAAAEATDAANAATDAANAAAEAADAATAAAQDAADAVAALSTQVSEMVNALKKQITALTNLVIKIQKKVKA